MSEPPFECSTDAAYIGEILSNISDKLDASKVDREMACGHPIGFIYSSDEGTSFCIGCAWNAERHVVAQMVSLLTLIQWRSLHANKACCPCCGAWHRKGHWSTCQIAKILSIHTTMNVKTQEAPR